MIQITNLLFYPLKVALISIVFYFVYKLLPRAINECYISYRYNQLPQFPRVGLAGYAVGIAELVYYGMQHLSWETSAAQIISGLNSFETSRKMGFVGFSMGFHRMIAFYSADTVESLVTSTTNLTKADQYLYLKPWLGSGLLTSTGNHWKNHRKLLTPAFHFKILESFFPIMNQNVQVMIDKIDTIDQSKGIDIRSLIANMSLDTICETAMGTTVGAQLDSVDKRDYINPINSALVQFMVRAINPLFQSDLIYNLSPSGQEHNRNINKIHSFVRKVIEDRREEMQSIIKSNNLDINKLEADNTQMFTKKRYAFLDLLLVTHLQRPKELTETDILDEVNTFMFEGHDTTSVGLIFALILIAGDERVQNKIYEELIKIFGSSNSDSEINMEQCRQMKYLEMCIKECLRLYPPVPTYARKIEHDFTVRGHQIPAGCIGHIFVYNLHRDTEVFPQPERFIPERFEPDSPVHKKPYAFMPFSAGPRNCIGQKFAMFEMKIVIASILRRYRLIGLTKRDQVELAIAVLIKARTPVVIRFEKRRFDIELY